MDEQRFINNISCTSLSDMSWRRCRIDTIVPTCEVCVSMQRVCVCVCAPLRQTDRWNNLFQSLLRENVAKESETL